MLKKIYNIFEIIFATRKKFRCEGEQDNLNLHYDWPGTNPIKEI